MSTPIPASTVLLLRPELDSSDEDFSIFFVRRHSKSAFMANAYVFPGGKLDGADSSPELKALCGGDGIVETVAVLDDLPPEVALGYFIAGLRETFEEAGVLLADREDGTPLALDEQEIQTRFNLYRTQMQEGELSMAELAREEGLTFRLDRLRYWDYWITPEVEERRYSARFFMAAMPDGFTPIHDSKETTESAWFTPSEILRRYEADRLTLAPPTLRILIELQELGSMEKVMQERADRRIPLPNLPMAKLEDSQFVLLLPGDKDYPGFSTPNRLHRATMESGKWVLIRN